MAHSINSPYSVSKRARHALILRRMGFQAALTMLHEADVAHISHALAAALTEQETGRGANIFGHDDVRNPAPKGGKVTKENYLRYKANRSRLGMQGVGPLQLTWWATQDRADLLGGCWKRRFNYRVGFMTLAALIRANGFAKGIERYNGSGPAAVAYSNSVRARHAKYARILK